MKRALQGKAPAHDNHRLLLYNNNGSLQYNNHTIDIVAWNLVRSCLVTRADNYVTTLKASLKYSHVALIDNVTRLAPTNYNNG